MSKGLPDMSNESDFKMTMSRSDLDPQFDDPTKWDALCAYATGQDEKYGVSNVFHDRFADLINTKKYPEMLKSVKSEMLDNYIVAAFAAKRAGLEKTASPLVSWAARNKRDFAGLGGEIAMVRYLLWAGFNPSDPDDNGDSALHHFCSLSWHPWCHIKGVSALILAGAEVDPRDREGNTPLMALCETDQWTNGHDRVAYLLTIKGADPFATAKSGQNPISACIEFQKQIFSPTRQAFIDKFRP